MLFICDKYTSRNPHENKLQNSLYRIERRIAKLAKIDICFHDEANGRS